jgi:UDP-glucose:(heptosyl)LPS alpha-1,3-glucosyltransferase
MKVLFCIDTYRPSRGGAEAYLRDLAAGLKARGHGVSVAAAAAEEDGTVEIVPVRVPARPRLRRERALARVPGRFKKHGAFDAVIAFRHAFDADVFQPHGGLHRDSLEGAVRPHARSPAMKRLLFLRKLLSPKNAFFLGADRRLLQRVRPLRIVALSEMTAASIRRRFNRAADITVIPNGVDTGRFHPGLCDEHRESVLAELGLQAGARVALFCGHNFVLKGLREALHGLAVLRTRGHAVSLLAVGRGRRTRYERLASGLGLDAAVHFLGERDDMVRLLGAADVLLHPTWYDPCSLVVLEALGAGVPVITTKYNGASELMTDGEEGFVLSDPGDAPSMAVALERVIGPDRERFRKKAAAQGRRRTFDEHVDRMEEVLAGVRGNRGQAAD